MCQIVTQFWCSEYWLSESMQSDPCEQIVGAMWEREIECKMREAAEMYKMKCVDW